jgi:hypothetical protein
VKESVFLAIGAAGAFARAGVAFPLPARWEDGQSFWSDDNAVREAFNVEDDEEAAVKIRRRIKAAGLRKASALVFTRRLMEVHLGMREDDSILGWLVTLSRRAVFAMLPSEAAEFFLDFQDEAVDLERRFAAAGAASPSEMLQGIDDMIDREIRRAGYTPRSSSR